MEQRLFLLELLEDRAEIDVASTGLPQPEQILRPAAQLEPELAEVLGHPALAALRPEPAARSRPVPELEHLGRAAQRPAFQPVRAALRPSRPELPAAGRLRAALQRLDRSCRSRRLAGVCSGTVGCRCRCYGLLCRCDTRAFCRCGCCWLLFYRCFPDRFRFFSVLGYLICHVLRLITSF